MADDVRNTGLGAGMSVQRLDLNDKITPEETSKRINDGEDLGFFLRSQAYTDIVTFVGQLNCAMFPVTLDDGLVRTWPTPSVHIIFSPQVMRIRVLIQTLKTILRETPPETGPRRFGNVAFRTWFTKVHDRIPTLLQQALPEGVWAHVEPDQREALRKELGEYLIGGLGSAERLDYGTGHELSFLAFLMGIWKLNGFAPSQSGAEERGIVVGIIEPYLELIRSLIKTYTLEPAGSHGVWGLDDHSFLPFVFGSAQLAPPVPTGGPIPNQGSLVGAPSAKSVIDEQNVRLLATQNLYFAAVTFIYNVKTGPFWEHSPMLYDISGIEAGWAKINKGLVKMYRAEVLAKFPVVQHLRFGSLLKWELDPNAPTVAPSFHAQQQPPSLQPPINLSSVSSTHGIAAARPLPVGDNTAAPWARPPQPDSVATGAPWARPQPDSMTTGAPWARSQPQTIGTAAPWARSQPEAIGTAAPWARTQTPPSASGSPQSPTRLPPRFQPSSPTGSFVVPNLRTRSTSRRNEATVRPAE